MCRASWAATAGQERVSGRCRGTQVQQPRQYCSADRPHRQGGAEGSPGACPAWSHSYAGSKHCSQRRLQHKSESALEGKLAWTLICNMFLVKHLKKGQGRGYKMCAGQHTTETKLSQSHRVMRNSPMNTVIRLPLPSSTCSSICIMPSFPLLITVAGQRQGFGWGQA